MSREQIEHETLAAFLDGKLDPAERKRVLRILAEYPEEYEVFADAARVAAELRGGSAVPIESRRRRGNRWLVTVPVLVAAGLAAVILAPRLLGGGALSPVELAERLTVVLEPGAGSLAAKLGATWDQPGWSVMRGSGAEVVEPARAFRLGARATDVEVAIRAGDSTALGVVGAELVDLLSGVDAGAASAAQYRRILDAGASAGESDRKEAAELLQALMGESVWFDLGAWTEAARVAALARNSGDLRSLAGYLPGIMDRMTGDSTQMRSPVYPQLELLKLALEAGAPVEQNRHNILDLLSQVIVAAGR
jgi:hypothetical protein